MTLGRSLWIALRFALALGIGGAGFLAVSVWRADESGRTDVLRTTARYSLDKRRPELVESLPFAPSSDFAADLLASEVVQDAEGRVPLRGLAGDALRMWIASMNSVAAEVSDTRNLLLDAVTVRPSWAYHYQLLGQVQYAADRREYRYDEESRKKWAAAFHAAARSAPSDTSIAATHAAALLDSWGALTDNEKRLLRETARRALSSRDFLQANVVLLTALFGEEMLRSVPREPAALEVSARAFALNGDSGRATSLFLEWEGAEKKARSDGLVALHSLLHRGDVDRLGPECLKWMRDHPVEEFADEHALGEVAEAVSLIPAGVRGDWNSDPRADVIEMALRTSDPAIPPAILRRAVDDLTGVPPSVRAEVYAAAGDLADAEDVMKRADSAGSFEWTPVLVKLARQELARGRPDHASLWISQVSPNAADECDVTLVRREIGVGSSSESASGVAMESPTATRKKSAVLCVDDRARAFSSVELRIRTEKAAFVDVGWDELRSRTVRVLSGETVVVRLAVGKRRGAHSVFAAVRTGSPITWSVQTVGG